MAINTAQYESILNQLDGRATLVAVSKTKPIEDIQALYDLGQRDFGENYVQELTEKAENLPKDIRWHFIGHLQSNKVKYIAPFIHLIHGVDSGKLLEEINKQAIKNNRVIDCLLQVYIAGEETKFGLDENELDDLFNQPPAANARICGLMGMASFSDNMEIVRSEFKYLKTLFDKLSLRGTKQQPQPINHKLEILSMGMSSDYHIAIEEGSNMVRIGSLLFGARNV